MHVSIMLYMYIYIYIHICLVCIVKLYVQVSPEYINRCLMRAHISHEGHIAKLTYVHHVLGAQGCGV